MHIGRSFTGTRLEDECPCPKAPCGLVVQGAYDPSCTQHPTERTKTMRQGHRDEDCVPRCWCEDPTDKIRGRHHLATCTRAQ